MKQLKQWVKPALPPSIYQALRLQRMRWSVRWGSWRRLAPISSVFGLDRGQPIDRYYIEAFLQKYSNDIRGHVLEIGDRSYTLKFGASRVTCSNVLHAVPGNPEATLIGDLATGAGIPHNTYDCIILTQTLPYIYNVQSAVANAYIALKSGGVVLATVPGIGQISRYDMDRWGDFWRFTDASAHRLFADVFGDDNVTIEVHGNVLTACAFLHGLSAEELSPLQLAFDDADYQVIIALRAVRREAD